LRQREDLRPVGGDDDGVLELSGPLLVLGGDRPAVVPDVVLDRAQGDHRLDGEGHTFLDDRGDRGLLVVQHRRWGVERRADAVAGEVPHHAVAEALGVGLDHPADDVELPAGTHRLDRSHGGFLGALDQQPGLLGDLTGQERGVGVAVHAADVGGDVDVADVTVLVHRRVRDSVADDLVQRRAARLLEAAVAERGRVGAVIAQELVHDLVDVVGGGTGLDRLATLLQRLGRDPARDAHRLDDLRRAHTVAPIPLRRWFAHILRAFDRRRDGARRALYPGLQWFTHIPDLTAAARGPRPGQASRPERHNPPRNALLTSTAGCELSPPTTSTANARSPR